MSNAVDKRVVILQTREDRSVESVETLGRAAAIIKEKGQDNVLANYVEWIALQYENFPYLEDGPVNDILDFLGSDSFRRDPSKKKLRKEMLEDPTEVQFVEVAELSERWHERLAAKEGSKNAVRGEYKTRESFIDFDDGWSIVTVPVDDLKVEGQLMGHCVGGHGYARRVTSGEDQILSLRDPKNRPHATIQLRTKNGKIMDIPQIAGKRNRAVQATCRPYIRKLVTKLFREYDCQLTVNEYIDILHNDEANQILTLLENFTDLKKAARKLREMEFPIHKLNLNYYNRQPSLTEDEEKARLFITHALRVADSSKAIEVIEENYKILLEPQGHDTYNHRYGAVLNLVQNPAIVRSDKLLEIVFEYAKKQDEDLRNGRRDYGYSPNVMTEILRQPRILEAKRELIIKVVQKRFEEEITRASQPNSIAHPYEAVAEERADRVPDAVAIGDVAGHQLRLASAAAARYRADPLKPYAVIAETLASASQRDMTDECREWYWRKIKAIAAKPPKRGRKAEPLNAIGKYAARDKYIAPGTRCEVMVATIDRLKKVGSAARAQDVMMRLASSPEIFDTMTPEQIQNDFVNSPYGDVKRCFLVNPRLSEFPDHALEMVRKSTLAHSTMSRSFVEKNPRLSVLPEMQAGLLRPSNAPFNTVSPHPFFLFADRHSLDPIKLGEKDYTFSQDFLVDMWFKLNLTSLAPLYILSSTKHWAFTVFETFGSYLLSNSYPIYLYAFAHNANLGEHPEIVEQIRNSKLFRKHWKIRRAMARLANLAQFPELAEELLNDESQSVQMEAKSNLGAPHKSQLRAAQQKKNQEKVLKQYVSLGEDAEPNSHDEWLLYPTEDMEAADPLNAKTTKSNENTVRQPVPAAS